MISYLRNYLVRNGSFKFIHLPNVIQAFCSPLYFSFILSFRKFISSMQDIFGSFSLIDSIKQVVNNPVVFSFELSPISTEYSSSLQPLNKITVPFVGRQLLSNSISVVVLTFSINNP